MNVQKMNAHLQNVAQEKGIPIPAIRQDLSNIKQVRDFLNTAKYVKGFVIDIANGQNTIDNIKLTGTAKFLLGIKFFVVQTEEVVDWQLSRFRWLQNNEVIIDDVPIVLYTTIPQFTIYCDEFYTLFRPLSGVDVFKLEINNPGQAYKLYPVLYYV